MSFFPEPGALALPLELQLLEAPLEPGVGGPACGGGAPAGLAYPRADLLLEGEAPQRELVAPSFPLAFQAFQAESAFRYSPRHFLEVALVPRLGLPQGGSSHAVSSLVHVASEP